MSLINHHGWLGEVKIRERDIVSAFKQPTSDGVRQPHRSKRSEIRDLLSQAMSAAVDTQNGG